MTYLDHVAECACLNLRRAALAVTAHYNEIMAPSGVLITQMSILAALAQYGALPLTQLSSVIGMDRTTLSRNLGPLERQRLIFETKGADKRTKVIELTDQGKSALRAAVPLWLEAQASVRTLLGDAPVSQLVKTLKEVSNVVS